MPLDETDLQVEFTSLDPYVRARLVPDGNGTFHADVPVPDHIGLYKFVVEYFRPGYTPISLSKTVSQRRRVLRRAGLPKADAPIDIRAQRCTSSH